MNLIFQEYIKRSDLHHNQRVLYLFGDNEMRCGMGGQAKECRGETNAVGVATKRRPSNEDGAFWSDGDFERCKLIIDADLEPAFKHVQQGGVVVCPSRGLGSGRSQLPEFAPRIFQYIRQRVAELRAAPPAQSVKV